MTKKAENKEDLKKQNNKDEDMAICPKCGGRVTGEYGGSVFYDGRYWHRSCLRRYLSTLRRRKPSKSTWYFGR